uniref:hypothetical protein n=1 Tax=Pseudodesulfovibrio sp. TaxID=2035812 RepID=UPI00257B63FE
MMSLQKVAKARGWDFVAAAVEAGVLGETRETDGRFLKDIRKRMGATCTCLSTLSVRLVVLDVQTHQHQSRSAKQAGNGSGAGGDAQGIELVTRARFDQAMEFFEVEARMLPEVREFEGLEQDEHFRRCL